MASEHHGKPYIGEDGLGDDANGRGLQEGEQYARYLAATGQSIPSKKAKRKRDNSALRKAPQAPKRFKSSYICFFMAKQQEIKEQLGESASVMDISKHSASMWRNLSPAERHHWEEAAAKDKQRYLVEKATYTGPWQVPWKRAKKDPSAPKRPMSAFLFFSQGRRAKIKNDNPELKNTDVSRILGEMWRNASQEERRPHVEKEKAEREKYKAAMVKWRQDCESKMEAERKTITEQQTMMMPGGGELPPMPMTMYSDETGVYQQPLGSPPMYAQLSPYCYPAYMPPTGPAYPFPVNGKTPVVLGPNGMPAYPAPYTGGPAVAQAGQPHSTQQQSPSSQGYEEGDSEE